MNNGQYESSRTNALLANLIKEVVALRHRLEPPMGKAGYVVVLLVSSIAAAVLTNLVLFGLGLLVLPIR